jgi:hypothetical protein
VKPTSAAFWLALVLLAAGCDQLGNPPQYATPPTSWKDARGHLVTSTRSFKNETTIRRLVSEGMDGFNYSDPSIGPSQALTLVVVVAHALGPRRQARRGKVELVTRFELPGRRAIQRTWSAPPTERKWSAAFALPAPPVKAVTVVAP